MEMLFAKWRPSCAILDVLPKLYVCAGYYASVDLTSKRSRQLGLISYRKSHIWACRISYISMVLNVKGSLQGR